MCIVMYFQYMYMCVNTSVLKVHISVQQYLLSYQCL